MWILETSMTELFWKSTSMTVLTYWISHEILQINSIWGSQAINL